MNSKHSLSDLKNIISQTVSSFLNSMALIKKS
jgi:hypothetical protein